MYRHRLQNRLFFFAAQRFQHIAHLTQDRIHRPHQAEIISAIHKNKILNASKANTSSWSKADLPFLASLNTSKADWFLEPLEDSLFDLIDIFSVLFEMLYFEIRIQVEAPWPSQIREVIKFEQNSVWPRNHSINRHGGINCFRGAHLFLVVYQHGIQRIVYNTQRECISSCLDRSQGKNLH